MSYDANDEKFGFTSNSFQLPIHSKSARKNFDVTWNLKHIEIFEESKKNVDGEKKACIKSQSCMHILVSKIELIKGKPVYVLNGTNIHVQWWQLITLLLGNIKKLLLKMKRESFASDWKVPTLKKKWLYSPWAQSMNDWEMTLEYVRWESSDESTVSDHLRVPETFPETVSFRHGTWIFMMSFDPHTFGVCSTLFEREG